MASSLEMKKSEVLLGMAAGGYVHRPEQEELLRGAAAAGLSAEDQANLAAGSDSIAEQQQAHDSSGDAVVAGAAGAAAFLAHSARAVLRDAARRNGALYCRRRGRAVGR